MIRALLIPATPPSIAPTPSPALMLETHRAVVSHARKEATAILARAKKRGRTYARRAEERGFEEGLRKGNERAVEKFKEVSDKICQSYAMATEIARQDVAMVACQIVEQTISSHLDSNSSYMRRWIDEAIERLKTTRPLTLRYHPRYEATIASLLSSLMPRITPLLDPTVGDADFILEGQSGGVSFAWRELLQPLHSIAEGRHES